MNLKKHFLTLNIIVFSFITGGFVHASIFDQVISGFKNTGEAAGYNPGEGGAPATAFIPAWVKYINGILFLIGALFMILVIYGGWLWMTARGNDEQVNRGKKILISAFIGLGVILAARIISEFTITQLGSTVQITQ